MDTSHGRCWRKILKIIHHLMIAKTPCYYPCLDLSYSPVLVCLPRIDPLRCDHVLASWWLLRTRVYSLTCLGETVNLWILTVNLGRLIYGGVFLVK